MRLHAQDADVSSEPLTLAITRLPRHGTLYRASSNATRLQRIAQAFSPHASVDVVDQFAVNVTAVSSFRTGHGASWHPGQALGPRDVFAYEDSIRAWCALRRALIFGTHVRTHLRRDADRCPLLPDGDWDGTVVSGADTHVQTVHGANLLVNFVHNPSLSYAQHGYTEFIELRFQQAVYPRHVFIGENHGMCSVVSIKAQLSTRPGMLTLWSGPAEPGCQAYYAMRRLYRTFSPSICQHARLVDTLRIELDTRTAVGWNQIDFVRLVGSTSLPPGVLPHDAAGVFYEPNAFFSDRDDFEVSPSQCPFRVRRHSL